MRTVSVPGATRLILAAGARGLVSLRRLCLWDLMDSHHLPRTVRRYSLFDYLPSKACTSASSFVLPLTMVIIPVLSACQTPLPPPAAKVEIQRVEVPGPPVKCKPDLGPEPMYVTNSEFMGAADILAAVKLWKAQADLLTKRMVEKDEALKKCAGD